MAVLSDRLRGLQKVLDLRQVGVGVAVVDERVQEGLPDETSSQAKAGKKSGDGG